MRFYDPERQMLAMLYEQLVKDAEQSGESPIQIFSQAFLHVSRRHKGALHLPAALCDPTMSAEQRYAWLCAQMDAYRESEAMRRAEWRMATEQTGQSILDNLLDDPTLPQTCLFLREDADTLVLATVRADESIVRGYRLHDASMQGNGIGVPVLLSTMELTVSLSGNLSLAAISAAGQVQASFSTATEITAFYDYSDPADPTSVLLLPNFRLSYCLHKLLLKALRTEPTALSSGEEALLPLSIGASFFCGKTDSVETAEQFAHSCGNAWLSGAHDLFRVAVKTFCGCASACGDKEALALLNRMEQKGRIERCRRDVRRFGAHCASAKGEGICRFVFAKLKEATACYPPSLFCGVASEEYTLVADKVDRTMRERGYIGAWPRYRKEHVLPSARLFCVGGIYPVLARAGTRVLSLVDCTTFLQGASLCVRFASGTVLLKKKERSADYLDSDSAAFPQRGRRRLQQFAAGLVLREEERVEQLDVVQTAVCAAKSAELVRLDSEEHLRVVHASRRPFWMAILLWVWIACCAGVGVGLFTWLLQGIGWVSAMLSPAFMGVGCGALLAATMLLLTWLGRRRL